VGNAAYVADIDHHVEERDKADGKASGAGEGSSRSGDLAEDVVGLVKAVVGEN
jgi:hypothetical protein